MSIYSPLGVALLLILIVLSGAAIMAGTCTIISNFMQKRGL